MVIAAWLKRPWPPTTAFPAIRPPAHSYLKMVRVMYWLRGVVFAGDFPYRSVGLRLVLVLGCLYGGGFAFLSIN